MLEKEKKLRQQWLRRARQAKTNEDKTSEDKRQKKTKEVMGGTGPHISVCAIQESHSATIALKPSQLQTNELLDLPSHFGLTNGEET